ncbi:FHA domain protein [compost metagenome]
MESTHGVSRAHVEIMNRREGCSLKDLGSRNGTLLNGEQVAPYKEYPINPGDVFTLADISFKIGKEPA